MLLQGIRDRAQGWLAWVIVGLISVPFALWGVNSYMDGSSNVTVANVNGVDIDLTQYQRELQNYRQRLQSMLGESFDINSMDQNIIKQEVLAALVDKQVMQQAAEASGMRIGNGQISAMIQSLEAFQDENGQFSNTLYERRLLQSGLSPLGFEQSLRGDMLQDQLRKGLINSAFVTNKESAILGLMSGQKRDIVYSTISADPLKDSIELTDEEINEYYEQNQSQFKTAEQVKISYIDLSIEELAKQVEVPEGALNEFYQSNIGKYTIEERRVAHHVLLPLLPEAEKAEVDKAQASAKKLHDLVKTGIEFDDIPKLHNDLLGDRDEVGKTGEISKGVMPVEFDEALFSMAIDEVSDIVRSKNGLHIIKLVEIKEGSIKGYEEVKEDVKKSYQTAEAEGEYFEIADELQNLTFENPDTLDVAADSLNLAIKQSAMFSNQPGNSEGEITQQSKVIEAAFREEVIEGANSEPLELSDSHMVVLRVEEHQPAAVKELALVREEIVSSLKTDKARSMAEAKGKVILEKLAAGETRDQIAASENIEWTAAKAVSRDDPKVKRSILRKVFKIGRPENNKPIYDGFVLGLNDYAVVGVEAVIDVEKADQALAEETTKAVDGLVEKRGTEAWSDFLSQLKENAEITTHPGAL